MIRVPSLRELGQAVLEALLPTQCVSCSLHGQWLCAACRSRLTWGGGGFCAGCLRPSAGGYPCLACSGVCPVDRLFAACSYRQPILVSAVESYKYHGVRSLADPLAAILITYLEHLQHAGTLAGPFTAVVPIPLHHRRLLDRGYQQVTMLAAPLAQHFGWPLRADLVRRVRPTARQVGLSPRARRANVANAFAASPVPEARVLLVDDVVTTGSTLRACTQALRQAGAREVVALALAHG